MRQVYSCINDKTKMSEEKPDCQEHCLQKMSDDKCGFIIDQEDVLKARKVKEMSNTKL